MHALGWVLATRQRSGSILGLRRKAEIQRGDLMLLGQQMISRTLTNISELRAANRQHAAVARTSVTASTPGASPSGSTPHAGSVAKIKIEFVDGSGTTRTTEEMSDFLNRAKACWLDIFKKAGVTVNSDHTVS